MLIFYFHPSLLVYKIHELFNDETEIRWCQPQYNVDKQLFTVSEKEIMEILRKNDDFYSIAHSILKQKYCKYFPDEIDKIEEESITGEATNDFDEPVKTS